MITTELYMFMPQNSLTLNRDWIRKLMALNVRYTDHINFLLFSETDIGLAIDAPANAILVCGDFSLDFLQF